MHCIQNVLSILQIALNVVWSCIGLWIKEDTHTHIPTRESSSLNRHNGSSGLVRVWVEEKGGKRLGEDNRVRHEGQLVVT